MITNAITSHLMGQPLNNGLFTGYARANNLRLSQVFSKKTVEALEKVGLQAPLTTTLSPVRPKSLSRQDSQFLADYRNSMLDLQNLANKVVRAGGERNPRAAGAENPKVADVTGLLTHSQDEYRLRVEQLASGQVERSAPIQADETFPTMSGSLRLETEKGDFDFYLSAAGLKDNRAMLESFAHRLNARDTGVTATVREEEDGRISLELENEAGEKNGYEIKGSLAGRLDFKQVSQPGERQAVYTVQKNDGEAKRFTAPTNKVAIDRGLTAKLKEVGETKITSAASADQGTADSISKLVDRFNETLGFLNQNGERSRGALNQIRRMVVPPTSENSMRLIGITAKKDGSLAFDRQVFLEQSQKAPTLTRSIVENFTQGIRSDARSGMQESSANLLGPMEYTQRFSDVQQLPYNVLSAYSRNSVYNMMNFYATGVLMSLNA